MISRGGLFINSLLAFRLKKSEMETQPHIELLLQLSRIDGEASKVELDLIRTIGSSKNFTDEAFEKAMEKMDDQPSLDSLVDLSEEEKIIMVITLIQVIKADGKVVPSEMAFCHDVIEKLGLNSQDFVELVLDILDKELMYPRLDLHKQVQEALF